MKQKQLCKSNRLITMLLLVMAILMPYGGAWAQTPTPPANGNGDVDTPYIITKAEELAWFRNQVNGGKNKICAKIADNVEVIDLKDFCHAEDVSQNLKELSWVPIGTANKPYKGTFDGNNKTITNLYIKTAHNNVGFFCMIMGATIQDLIFDNAKVENVSTTYTKALCTGILAGGSDAGTNPPSHIKGIKTTKNCTVIGQNDTGGIVGNACNINIENCENRSSVKGESYVGGIAGNYYYKNIKRCTNYGTVETVKNNSQRTGGIIGYANGTSIEDCANYGKLTSKGWYYGGIAGEMRGNSSIQNVFSYGDMTYTYAPGIIIGYVDRNSTLTAKGIVAYNKEALLNNSSENINNIVGTGTLTFEDGKGEADVVKAFTKQQIKSGEVAWLLNGSTSVPTEGSTLVWYQKLGDNADAYPVLKSTGDNTVYKASLFSCDGTTHIGEYANNPDGDKLPHNYQMAETPDEGTSNLYGEECSLCHTVKKDGTKYIKNFCGIKDNIIKLTVESDGSYTAVKPVDINDNAAYDSPVDFTAPTLNYTRSFAHDKWQALYVPFETKVTGELLNDFELAAPNNLHEYELADGKTKISLEAKLMKSGYTIKAQRPYLIRAKEAGEKTIQLTDCPLKEAAEDSYVDCSSVLRHYKFIGTLKGKTSFDTSADFVLQQGVFLGTETDTQLKPMRWYLNATDRNTDMGILPGSGNNGDGADGGNGSTQASRSINITIVDGDATTGIDDLHVITEQASGSKNGARLGIYDLQGRKLSQEPQNGVYIKDGKKVIK